MLDKKIEYFILVVQEGSFSAAARKLYLSQSNLSKQILQLETNLGVSLFDRTGYKPVLTDAGSFYYLECLKMQRLVSEVLEKVEEYQAKPINIGFTGAFENREILEAINKFRENVDDSIISLNRFNFEGCVNALLSGVIDVSFGLESTFKRYKEIKYDILHAYDICLICAHNHPFAKLKNVSASQLKEEEFIILSKTFSKDFYHDFMDACKQDGFKPKIKKEVDSFDELVFSVSIGEGIAIAGRSVVRENEVKAVHIEGTHHVSNFVIAYLDHAKNVNIEKFVKTMQEYFETL